MQATLQILRNGNGKEAALRIRPPTQEGGEVRTPVHFTCLIDVSDSMYDDNKLSHVKQCLRLLLDFLTDSDELSLITFGNDSTVILKRMKMTGPGKEGARGAIEGLNPNGCTNLSAGLASVREVLSSGQGAQGGQSRRKEGVLILTDGHANKGVHRPEDLRGLGNRIRELFPTVAISYIAYGTDHNAELLKQMAEDVNGAYSIVADLEGAALTMGEALGDVLSCVAQNVKVGVPAGTKVLGPHRRRDASEKEVWLGDLYSGTDILLILEFPDAADTKIAVEGALLPSLDLFSIEIGRATPADPERRDVEVELTRIRYRVSDLFRRIRIEWAGEGESFTTRSLEEELRQIIAALEDSAFEGQPLHELLRNEIPSLRRALDLRGTGAGRYNSRMLQTQLLQHEAFVGLGRGTSLPLQMQDPTEDEYYEGGRSPIAAGDPHPPVQAHQSYLSPLSSSNARRVAMQLRSLSGGV